MATLNAPTWHHSTCSFPDSSSTSSPVVAATTQKPIAVQMLILMQAQHVVTKVAQEMMMNHLLYSFQPLLLGETPENGMPKQNIKRPTQHQARGKQPRQPCTQWMRA